MALTEAAEFDGDLTRVINSVGRDKNLDKAIIIDALEQAVLHAARRDYGATADLEAEVVKNMRRAVPSVEAVHLEHRFRAHDAAPA